MFRDPVQFLEYFSIKLLLHVRTCDVLAVVSGLVL